MTTSNTDFGPTPVIAGAQRWTLAVPASVALLDVRTAAHMLAARLEALLGDGLRIDVIETVEPGLEAITTGGADLYLGLDASSADWHPGFHVTSGLPTGVELAPAEQAAWLTVGDGAELLQALADRFDAVVKPAFVTGPSYGLLSDRLIETADDVRGRTIACRGLARRVATHLHAIPVDPGTPNVDLSEPLIGPPLPQRHWRYAPGLMAGGHILSVGTRATLWARLGRSRQLAIEGAVSELLVRSQADAIVRTATLAQVDAARRWPVATSFDAMLRAQIQAGAEAALDAVATFDPLAQRLVASHRLFHARLRESASPPVASV
jgi:hypothetical protein